MKANIANNIVVIGLGMTGVSVVKYLVKHWPDKTVKVIDTRLHPPGEEELPSGVALHTGSLNEAWIYDAGLIVVSPGVSLHETLLKKAAEKEIEIIGDIELFARAVKAPVIGITGSNGKSTVTSLLGEMAKIEGIHAGVGGNIGVPALDLLEQNHSLYILELSSFQLETTHSLMMEGAVFLNFSEDHMDRYVNLSDYFDAKQRIFTQTKCAIWNKDDPSTHPLVNIPSYSFGFTNADYSLKNENGQEYLCVKKSNEKEKLILAVSEIGLFGRHNVANCLAAMALADTLGISRAAQIKAMKNYQGLAHRCQKVLQHKGIAWVNDSKATNLASTLAALEGLNLAGRLHLLVGGDSKGADLFDLKKALLGRDVSLYCFGRDSEKFMPLHPSATQFETMEQAMALAYENARADDVILLSPACASLDQFRHFMARGDAFIRYAHHLSNLQQEPEKTC